MSAEEDTELRDLVAQTLEANGILGKLRAELRASVFLALEDQENGQNKSPFADKELRSFLSTKEGMLTANLVQEFLECLNLEFTLAVFKPEIGMNETVKRSDLIKELKIPLSNVSASTPLLTCLLHQHSKQTSTNSGSGDSVQISKVNMKRINLTDKQIEEARKKFEYYDKDGSGAIDKDELRDLFLDMFPNFHRNMLERYVNDEFAAVDKDFNSSIDFDEFLGMYKRLFLLCRTVVSEDVADIVSPTHKPGVKQQATPQQQNKQLSNKSKPDIHNSNPPKIDHSTPKANTSVTGYGSDIEEDPFFDDQPAASVSFNTLSSVPSNSVSPATRRASPYQPSQIPRFQQQSELEKNREYMSDIKTNGTVDKGKKTSGGMSSLNDLPSLTGHSLTGGPPLERAKTPENDSPLNDSDTDKNLREVDKRIVELGLGDTQNDDYEYEDDFSEVSQKSPRNARTDSKPENGSIAEEIDDEEIAEDISGEADDLLRSEKSGFDDLTTDHSISQIDGGFDYMEDPVLP
ncbi:unnamed protein product [Lymnaea stagnalis]|uniref:EF-hand domain-containing protein n=1 Tax=Lymnaea stagnalis TaxID=6523 RepID=A0AAV2IHS7_LYMST